MIINLIISAILYVEFTQVVHPFKWDPLVQFVNVFVIAIRSTLFVVSHILRMECLPWMEVRPRFKEKSVSFPWIEVSL